MSPTAIEVVGAALFGIAVAHTFLTKYFEHLAHIQPAHAGVWHLLGEVEVVFGFWAFVLLAFMFFNAGPGSATHYLEGLNFTEPAFVFVIMVVAASRPILELCKIGARSVASFMPMKDAIAFYFVCLSIIPLLGSFITEPAAMTLAAIMLRDNYYTQGISRRLKYATLGVLFVNISIGGTLTPFAAPPVLMVAGKWNWDIWFMLANFGWKAAVAVVVNAAAVTMLFKTELDKFERLGGDNERSVPFTLMAGHVLFLFGVPLKGSAITLAMGTVVYAAAATGYGLFISSFTSSQVAAIFAAAVLSMLPTMQFSGMMQPVSTLEGGARLMGSMWPTTYYMHMSVGAFTKGLSFTDMQTDLLSLIAFPLVFVTFSVLLLKKQEK